jgi:sulfur carrier protein
MNLTVNGEIHQIACDKPLKALLVDLGLGDQPCAVEINGIVVPKREHSACTLGDGDVIEIVTLVGGG